MAFFPFFSRKPNQSTPNRRRATLGVENLEVRATPTGNVISGFVYHDVNNNGIFDTGESPIANVAVQLKNNATNAIVGNAITDSNGFYQFTNDGSVVTTPTSVTKTVSFPDTDTNFDLTGVVDQFDPSLGTLNSIDVIHDGSITSSILVENTSRASGSTINGTVSGNLNLVAPGINDALTLSQNAGSISVARYDNTLDFTGASGGNLGTKTANGTKTTTLTGSALSAWEGSGQVTVEEIGTATSNASGGGNITAAITSSGRSTITVKYNYTPNNGLQPGAYTITETQPQGYTDGKDALGGVPIPNSIGTDTIVLTLANTSLPNNNFGELQSAGLSGYVYVDANDNGIREAEQPISGVTITLTGFTADGPVSQTAVTDGSGFYQFTNLKPGTYGLQEGNPGAQYLDGKDTIGSQGGTAGNDNFSSITLASGASGVNNNFGEILPASVAGMVFFDANSSGALDPGETGIANTTVTLTGTDGNGAVSRTATTDAAGNYSFTNLRPGTYAIAETQPAGYKDGQDSLGTLGGTASNDLFSAIALTSGAAGINYNFGEVPLDDADVGIVKTASAAQNNVGDTLTYTLVVTNYSANAAKGLTVTDTLPPGAGYLGASGAGWSISQTSGIITATMPMLAANASSTITVQIRVPAASSTITNTAVVSTTTQDKNPTNNSSSVTTRVVVPDAGIDPLVTQSSPNIFYGKNQFFSDTYPRYAADQVNTPTISGIYQTLLKRQADPGGLANFLNLMYQGWTAAQVTQTIMNSTEYRGVQVKDAYAAVLGRTPTVAESQNGIQALSSGASVEAFNRSLYASAEYQAQHPDSANLAGSLYVNIAGTLPSAATSQATVQSMGNSTLDSVVLNIQQTDDAYRKVIADGYRHVLRRNASDFEINNWLPSFKAMGLSQTSFLQILLSSQEFVTLAYNSRV